MTNVSNEEKRFDYIVVGAGAAGSVLAAELSASGEACRSNSCVTLMSVLFALNNEEYVCRKR
jgi:ketopantoate reductase